jgi:hypothetical protein
MTISTLTTVSEKRIIKVQSTGPVILGTIGHNGDALQGLPDCILCDTQALTMHQHPFAPITTVTSIHASSAVTIYQVDMFTVVATLAAAGNWCDLYVDAGGLWQVIRKG